jgi:hypothetical protein
MDAVALTTEKIGRWSAPEVIVRSLCSSRLAVTRCNLYRPVSLRAAGIDCHVTSGNAAADFGVAAW